MAVEARSTSNDVPVLIIGGGPVGLSLSLELAYRGVRSTLIDQGDGVVRMSKMGHVSVRSMEHCRRWGVSEAVRNCGFPEDYPLNQVFCTSLNGQPIATIEYPSIAEEPSSDLSPEKKQRCPQLWFDPILARAAQAAPEATLLYHAKLVSFEQTEHGIRAEYEDLRDESLHTITADYMVGCDGSGSMVRRALGIVLEGDPVLSYSTGIYFTAPDLAKYHDKGPATRYWMIGEDGTWGNLTVVDAKDIWRLTVTGSQEKVEAKDFDADYWLGRCLGRPDIPYSITAVLPWRRSRLVADRYREGRVFLAGDACHVNAPNGGYGMNTGLGDSVDLGWKLAATIQGWGGEGLLDSYEIERRPVAQRNVDAAAVNFGLTRPKISYAHVEDDTAEGAQTRVALGEVMVNNTRQEWETYGVHLGYRYEGSPVIVPDGTLAPEDHLSDYRPTARPGHRAPHVPLNDGRSILDLFGPAFVLLAFSKDGFADDAVARWKAAAAERGIPFRVEAIENPAAAALYESPLVLVRPDGHVAWRGDLSEVDAGLILETTTGRGAASGEAKSSSDISEVTPAG